MNPKIEYDDNYPTCRKTHSTFRVFSDEINPDEITKIFNFAPTNSFQKGEPHSKGLYRKNHGWFYTTKQLTQSKDTRRHIDMILTALDSKMEAIEKLHQKGCSFDIVSYWVSNGQGGPALWPHQMVILGKLGIGVWWDIYFASEDK